MKKSMRSYEESVISTVNLWVNLSSRGRKKWRILGKIKKKKGSGNYRKYKPKKYDIEIRGGGGIRGLDEGNTMLLFLRIAAKKEVKMKTKTI